MTINYNPKKAQEDSFERVGPGTYLCQVEDAQEKTSSNGDPMISLRWKAMEGGFTICFDNLTFRRDGKGVGIVHKKLKMMGVPVGDDIEDFALDAADLVGCEAMLTLVEDTYTDKSGKKHTNLKPDFDAPGFGYALSTSTAAAKDDTAEAAAKLFGTGTKADDTPPW